MERFLGRTFAKVNLSLAITGKRGNLHTLDMIVCPYEKLYDEVTFVPMQLPKQNETYCKDGTALPLEQSIEETFEAQDVRIEVEDVHASFEGFKPDLFLKFYLPKVQAIAKEFGVSGTLCVEKNIPLAAGLGGSSASVVAALKAVLAYLKSKGIKPHLSEEFLLSLGSDTPCMLLGGVCRVQGTGELVTPLNDSVPNDMHIEIAEGGSDSGKCYQEYDKQLIEHCGNAYGDEVPDEHMSEYVCNIQGGEVPYEHNGECVCNNQRDEVPDSVESALAHPRNDLTEAAIKINPNIGELMAKMREKYNFVLMSGSGSAVVGIGKKTL